MLVSRFAVAACAVNVDPGVGEPLIDSAVVKDGALQLSRNARSIRSGGTSISGLVYGEQPAFSTFSWYQPVATSQWKPPSAPVTIGFARLLGDMRVEPSGTATGASSLLSARNSVTLAPVAGTPYWS